MQNVAENHSRVYTQSSGSKFAGNEAISAQKFQNAIASRQDETAKGGSNSFLAGVLAASDPMQKLAMMEGFAAGYADAMKKPEKRFHIQPADVDNGGGTQGTGSAGAPRCSAGKDPRAIMNGYKALAEQIASSDLPSSSKNQMLDDIAQEMAKLRDQNPPGAQRSVDTPPSSDGTASPSNDPTSSSNGQDGKVWTQEIKDGVATIHLGDEYTLRVSETGESVTITNNWTGAVTNIWGDPHIDVGNDGKNDFNFKDGMTMKLDNGLEIRLGTLMDGGASFTTSLTILQGDRAMQVTGIAGDRDGKGNLSVVQSNEGRALANLTPNGAFVIQEAGKGWATTGGNAVTQSFIDDSELLYHGQKTNRS